MGEAASQQDEVLPSTSTGSPEPISDSYVKPVTEIAREEREEVMHDIDADVEKANQQKELTDEQKLIIEKLKRAAGSEERVRLFATYTDTYGLDALVSLIPELGDAGSSVVAGLYLIFEGARAGVSTGTYLKIIGLQTADFFIGAIPVAGDVADYFFKANRWTVKDFEKRKQQLAQQAREAGVSEEKISLITEGMSAKIPRLASRAVTMAGKMGVGKKAPANDVE